MSKLEPSTTRLADTILGLEYGDEQERLRYYEAYAVIVHLQLIMLPIVGAVVVFVAGTSAVVPLLAVLAAFFGSILFGKLHLQRYQVPMELIALSGRNRTYIALYALAWVLFIVAMATAGMDGSSFRSGFAVGALIGAVVGLVTLAIRARRQRSMFDDQAAGETDGDDAERLSS